MRESQEVRRERAGVLRPLRGVLVQERSRRSPQLPITGVQGRERGREGKGVAAHTTIWSALHCSSALREGCDPIVPRAL